MQTPRRYFITLASGRRVGLGSYARGVRHAIAHPEATFAHGLSTWGPTTGAEIRRQFRAGLHDRINERGGVEVADARRLHEHGTPTGVATTTGRAVGRARIHQNQAQWRRRLTGQRHTWEGDDDEPTYICQDCEQRHGVPGADSPWYLGTGGYLPLQHLGRDRKGNGLIPHCDHPAHVRAA